MATQEMIRGLPPFFQVHLDRKTPEEQRAHLAEMSRIDRRNKRKHDYDRKCLLRDENWDIGPYVSIYDTYWQVEENLQKQVKQNGDLALLGLDANASLCKRDVINAYRRKARKLHPDVGGDAESFKQLHAAYRKVLAATPK